MAVEIAASIQALRSMLVLLQWNEPILVRAGGVNLGGNRISPQMKLTSYVDLRMRNGSPVIHVVRIVMDESFNEAVRNVDRCNDQRNQWLYCG